eukprot:5796138-Ditylum_brightwellii.AAC.1
MSIDDDEVVLVNDGLDEGPAPLQTVQPPEVICEGALHNAVKGRNAYKSAEKALTILDEKAKSLAREVRMVNENMANSTSTILGQISQGRTTDTFDQSNIFPT